MSETRQSEDGPLPAGPDAAASPKRRADRTTVRAWWRGEPLPPDMRVVLGLVLPMMLAAANMWRVHAFTIDDSYISYRYARNLVNGLGLVYNAGERVEGYTNFLWTLILAGGIKLGIDPEVLSKGLGASAAFATLGLTYAISGRILPYRTAPCIATWLLGSTIVLTGWSVFGLETGFFVSLVLAGTYLMFTEEGVFGEPSAPAASAEAKAKPSGWRAWFPWSGVAFALAGLTRPEAPMFVGLLMLSLGKKMFGRRNLARGVVFALPIAAHLLFRHAYYGSWVPNTLVAKTGNLDGQLANGLGYVKEYAEHAGLVVYLAVLGAAFGLLSRRRDVIALTVLAVAVVGYVVLVGGDWMKFFRFMAPFEPLCFLLVDVGVRRTIDRRDGPTNLAIAAFGVSVIVHRAVALRDAQSELLRHEKRFWDAATQGTARWLLVNEPGEVALGDIGYVGWATDYPILDLLGLVDPVISRLPGGYTQKLGPGFLERFFEKQPKYFLLISSNVDCQHPSVIGSTLIWTDRRFHEQYELGGSVTLERGFAWCIYQRRSEPAPPTGELKVHLPRREREDEP
jgi:hypothetical protein